MANCKNCGAALPPDSMICVYCNTRRDIDLEEVHRYTVEAPESDRTCPRCEKKLQTIDIKLGGKFLIERCKECLGLFFDPGELETLVDKSVANVYQIDYSRIDELQKTKRCQEYPVKYIKCPVCRKLMNRLNFGAQSGVIVDKCRDHGMWLDGGELRQILEWTKAGGKIIHEKKQVEIERLQLQEEREKLRSQEIAHLANPHGAGDYENFPMFGHTHNSEDFNDLFDKLTRVVGRLFR
jgi:Zn-finger nucleic acid-binding protein